MSTPTTTEAPARPRGMRGTGRNMVISMLVIVLGVIAWIAIVPRPSGRTEPVENTGSIAREVNRQQHWRVALPRGLGEGWVPTNVRLMRLSDQPRSWHAGYQAPSGDYASAEQVPKAGKAWIRKQTAGGKADGTVRVGGATWTVYKDGDSDQQALVRSDPLAGLSTVVVGTADLDELRTFAGALRPTPAAS